MVDFPADHTGVAEKLIEHGANLNANDLHFGTPLHVTAFKNHLNSARTLLRHGTSPRSTHTHTCRRTLTHAHAHSHTCRRTLTHAHAHSRIHSATHTCTLPFIQHTDTSRNTHRWPRTHAHGTHLQRACINTETHTHTLSNMRCAHSLTGPHTCTVIIVYLDGGWVIYSSSSGANVNATKMHQTALHLAARQDSVLMIELLLDAGEKNNRVCLWARTRARVCVWLCVRAR